MLASICPLGERARRQSYPITVAAYIAASSVAAALLGTALAAIGVWLALPGAALFVIAGLAIAGLVLDMHPLGLHVPGPRRQVNEDWLAIYRGWVYGAGYGAQLGSGVTTIVSGSITWIAWACALFAGSVVGGLVVGATFGLVRALPVLCTAHVHDVGGLRRLLAHVEQARARVAYTATALQGLVALALVAMVAERLA